VANEQKGKPSYPIESVDNALRLLLMFRTQNSIRVSEAGEAIGVARSTAHRLLAMLQYHGFVVQDEPSRDYRAGPALVDVGLAVVRHMDIRVQARPFLERLAADVEETVHLAVLRGPEIVFVDSVETSRAVRVGSRTGVSMPAHCTAVGKAMLSRMTSEQLHELYPSGRLKGITKNSISTRAELERELQDIRDRGYAINDAESEPDLVAIAMPVVGTGSGAVGAVTISGPLTRWNRDELAELVAPLGACVEAIEAGLR
jgi:IclR family acetate operon transcriptional repressor